MAPVGSVVAYVRGAAELSVAHAFAGADALVIRADGAPGVPWAIRLSCGSKACRAFRAQHAGRLVSDGATLLSEHGALLIRGLAAGRVYVFGAAVDASTTSSGRRPGSGRSPGSTAAGGRPCRPVRLSLRPTPGVVSRAVRPASGVARRRRRSRRRCRRRGRRRGARDAWFAFAK